MSADQGAHSEEVAISSVVTEHLDEVLEVLEEPEGFSVYEDYGVYKLFLIRRMTLEEKALSFVTDCFLFRDENVYLVNKDKTTLKKLDNGYDALLEQLESYYVGNQRIVNGYSTEIGILEEHLFNRTIPSYYMDLWFDLKKDLSKIENFYFRNALVYREFFKKTENKFNSLKDEFKDIEEGIQFQSSYVDTLSSRLDSLHNYYESIKDDRLNKTLLTLTVISGIFLPLNLIVGFFGMNTPGLFFQQDPTGTEKVIAILVAVLVVTLVGLRVVKAVDHYFLRFLLGRYNFYQRLTSRLDEIDGRLKGK